MAEGRIPSPPLPAMRRHALVIANSIYSSSDFPDLAAPRHDAARMTAMLEDPDICGFEVTTLIDATGQEIRLAMNRVFKDRDPDDFVLVYVSGHGVKDGNGRLYFVARDSDNEMLPATAVSARYLLTLSKDSDCNRQVIILDCCNSGAFDKGPAVSEFVDADREALDALPTGRFVLTASRQAESAQQRRVTGGDIDGSVFTSALIEGIVSGEADAANTGKITVQDAYRYAFTTVRRQHKRQNPQLNISRAEGGHTVLLARNPAGIKPGTENLYRVIALLDEPHAEIQEAALRTLGRLTLDPNPVTAAAVRNALAEQAGKEDHILAPLARDLLTGSGAGGDPEQPSRNAPPPPRVDHHPPGPDANSAPARARDTTPPDDAFGYDPSPAFADPAPSYSRDSSSPDAGYEPPIFDELEGLSPVEDPLGVFNVRRVRPLDPEPSYRVARYLIPTERYYGEWWRHWFYIARAVVVTGAAAAGALLVHQKRAATEALLARPLPEWIPFEVPASVHGIPRATILMWALIVLAAIGARQELHWATWRMCLSDSRIMIVRGIVRRHVSTIMLNRVTDVRLTQSMLGSVLSYGTLTFYIGYFPVRRVRYVRNPNEMLLRILEGSINPKAVEARLGTKDSEGEDA